MVSRHIFFKGCVLLSLVAIGNACFCPPVISSSCGCGGGGGGGASYYGGSYAGGYPTSGGTPGYAVFYRDLTPFRPIPQNQYYPPQAYSSGPVPALPPMYPPPNPRYIQSPPIQQHQQPQLPQQSYQRPRVVQRPFIQPRPSPAYVQPSAPVAPLDTKAVHSVLHDNELNVGTAELLQTTSAPEEPVVTEETIVAETSETEVPDFEDEETPAPVAAKQNTAEKDEFYYVYYDDKGKKVGDSRAGTTYPPQDIVETVTDTVTETATVVPTRTVVETTTQPSVAENESYDDIVEEETPAPIPATPVVFQPQGTTLAQFVDSTQAPTQGTTAAGGDVVYVDETVEYEDEKPTVTQSTTDPVKPSSKPNAEYKRGLQDNQILVDAADEANDSTGGYRNRVAASRGVKIVKRFPIDSRKIHSN